MIELGETHFLIDPKSVLLQGPIENLRDAINWIVWLPKLKILETMQSLGQNVVSIYNKHTLENVGDDPRQGHGIRKGRT